MIYRIADNWPLEYSPSIEKYDSITESYKNDVARALISEEHPEICKGLKSSHCIPVGESYPFITVELAEYLEPHTGKHVFFKPAEIIYKDKVFTEYRQFCVKVELDCIAVSDSVFDNDIIAYAKFKENEHEGCWVSNMPYTHNVVQICSQDFEQLIKNSRFSENSFRFLFGCCPFVSYMIEYFEKEICRILAEKLKDPDYQRNPFLLRNKRPDLFDKIIKIGKMPGEHIDKAASGNLSKDEYLALLIQQALLIIDE